MTAFPHRNHMHYKPPPFNTSTHYSKKDKINAKNKAGPSDLTPALRHALAALPPSGQVPARRNSFLPDPGTAKKRRHTRKCDRLFFCFHIIFRGTGRILNKGGTLRTSPQAFRIPSASPPRQEHSHEQNGPEPASDSLFLQYCC